LLGVMVDVAVVDVVVLVVGATGVDVVPITGVVVVVGGNSDDGPVLGCLVG
jgi:hypothetical protein